jgi:hypothetical protein
VEQKGPNTNKEQTDGMMGEWERSATYEIVCSWTTQDVGREDHHKTTTLHHMVALCSNNEGNILR